MTLGATQWRVIVRTFLTQRIIYRSRWTSDYFKARDIQRRKQSEQAPHDVYLDSR